MHEEQVSRCERKLGVQALPLPHDRAAERSRYWSCGRVAATMCTLAGCKPVHLWAPQAHRRHGQGCVSCWCTHGTHVTTWTATHPRRSSTRRPVHHCSLWMTLLIVLGQANTSTTEGTTGKQPVAHTWSSKRCLPSLRAMEPRATLVQWGKTLQSEHH